MQEKICPLLTRSADKPVCCIREDCAVLSIGCNSGS